MGFISLIVSLLTPKASALQRSSIGAHPAYQLSSNRPESLFSNQSSEPSQSSLEGQEDPEPFYSSTEYQTIMVCDKLSFGQRKRSKQTAVCSQFPKFRNAPQSILIKIEKAAVKGDFITRAWNAP
ncbi:hypothetical protein MAP00_008617 [Monascus purpureus]|nr:hypothetical protein MAP00_008617 [Monascus purpureus]